MLLCLPNHRLADLRASRREAAFTLLEAVIGMTLFSFVAVGTIAVTFMVRSTSERAVYDNTTLTLAQAYLEQLRSVDFSTLRSAAADATGTVALNLIASNGSVLTDVSSGVFGNGDWAQETIMLDEDALGTATQPMTFRFRPVIRDLNTITAGTADGVEVVLYYQCTYNFGTLRTLNGSLRTVRSNVSTF